MSFAVASISAMGLTLALVHGEPEPVSITIDGLVTQALAANPEVKFYKAEIAVAKAGRSMAGRLPNPQLDLDVGYKKLRGDVARSEGLAYAVTLAQPVEWPGRLGLRNPAGKRRRRRRCGGPHHQREGCDRATRTGRRCPAVGNKNS